MVRVVPRSTVMTAGLLGLTPPDQLECQKVELLPSTAALGSPLGAVSLPMASVLAVAEMSGYSLLSMSLTMVSSTVKVNSSVLPLGKVAVRTVVPAPMALMVLFY